MRRSMIVLAVALMVAALAVATALPAFAAPDKAGAHKPIPTGKDQPGAPGTFHSHQFVAGQESENPKSSGNLQFGTHTNVSPIFNPQGVHQAPHEETHEDIHTVDRHAFRGTL